MMAREIVELLTSKLTESELKQLQEALDNWLVSRKVLDALVTATAARRDNVTALPQKPRE